MDLNYIGSGIVFPIELTSGGFPVLRSGTSIINSSIKMILSWPVRQRIFLDEFGSLVPSALGEPNDQLVRGLVEHYVYDSLTRWEKRILIKDVTTERTESAKLTVSITYVIKSSGLEEVLTFPFYKNLPY
jgi:phage baseplate assembly protein W